MTVAVEIEQLQRPVMDEIKRRIDHVTAPLALRRRGRLVPHEAASAIHRREQYVVASVVVDIRDRRRHVAAKKWVLVDRLYAPALAHRITVMMEWIHETS